MGVREADREIYKINIFSSSHVHRLGENKTVSCVLYPEWLFAPNALSRDLPTFNGDAISLLAWLSYSSGQVCSPLFDCVPTEGFLAAKNFL